MPAKFTPAARRAHILTVESLYLSGKTQADIAAQIGVSQQQVSKYLVKLQNAWLARLGEKLESAKGRELAKLDRLEREHWQAWARSCENAQTTVNRAKTISIKAEDESGLIEMPALDREWTHTERGQAGDPRFLQGVKDCIEMRLKIVGGFAPTEVEVRDWRERARARGVDPDGLVSQFKQLIVAGKKAPTNGSPGDAA
jgi:predicted transcriptional regulator